MNTENKHFIYIFWFNVGLTVFSLGYIVAITFFHVPKDNIRFADAAQGFIMGTLITTGVNFFMGSSSSKPKSDNSVNQTNINTDTKNE